MVYSVNEQRDDVPERGLLVAIIFRAVQDALNSEEDAKEWIDSNNESPFSFKWCVMYGMCTSDADRIVNRIRNYITTEEGKVKRWCCQMGRCRY